MPTSLTPLNVVVVVIIIIIIISVIPKGLGLLACSGSELIF